MKTIKVWHLTTTALKQSHSAIKRMSILTIMLATSLVIYGGMNCVQAEMLPKASSFGPDTITYDTETGLAWLDVTLSTSYSYAEILIELEAGGKFYGYRLATEDEILSFWENAGINVDSGFFNFWTTNNFQPIVDLMSLVGISGPNQGNLGGGNYYDFTAGFIDYTFEYPNDPREWVVLAALSADPDPMLKGQPSFGVVPTTNHSEGHGAWLISKLGELQVLIGNPSEAYWRRAGTTIWFPSGYTESSLKAGTYILEFSIVPGWNTKGTETVSVSGGQTTRLEVTYTLNTNLYRISVSSADPNGTVSGGGNFIHNSLVTLTAAPAQGYAFRHWREGTQVVSGAGATYTFLATAARSLVAYFWKTRPLPGVLLLLDE